MSSNSLVTREQGPMAISEQERKQVHEALDKLIDTGIGGSTHDPEIAASFMEYANRRHILLTSVMGAFRMRPGWELGFTKLKIDTDKNSRMVYKVSDEFSDSSREWGPDTLLAFHKPALHMIRTHLGIEIKDMVRIDDRSKQYCYEFKIIAEYLGVDGQIKTLVDQGGIDLSDGSATVEKMRREAKGNTEAEREKKFQKAVDQKRAKAMQLATTNAEERLILSYGFRSSFTKAELDSKFIVCVRPIYTGFHPDPEVQRMLLMADLSKGETAKQLLFGMGAGPSANAGLPETEARAAVDTPRQLGQSSSAGQFFEEDTQQAQPKQCTPDECFGKGASHVRACNEPVTTTQIQQAEAWAITDGSFTGLKVNDLKVPSQALSSLLDQYTDSLESGGDLSEDDVKRLKHKRSQVEAELKRRGILN